MFPFTIFTNRLHRVTRKYDLEGIGRCIDPCRKKYVKLQFLSGLQQLLGNKHRLGARLNSNRFGRPTQQRVNWYSMLGCHAVAFKRLNLMYKFQIQYQLCNLLFRFEMMKFNQCISCYEFFISAKKIIIINQKGCIQHFNVYFKNICRIENFTGTKFKFYKITKFEMIYF